MKALRNILDKVGKPFHKGGKYEKFYPAYEAIDTFAFTPDSVTTGPTQVRDAMDLKRMMIVVFVALIPCVVMALWNTGFQANQAWQAVGGGAEIPGWRGSVIPSGRRLTSFCRRCSVSSPPLAPKHRSRTWFDWCSVVRKVWKRFVNKCRM